MATLSEDFEVQFQTVGGNNARANVRYTVFGAADEAAVRTLAGTDLPGFYNGMPLQSYDIIDHIDDTTWRILANYGPTERQPTVAPGRAFDTTGSTVNIKQALQEVSRYPVGAPDMKGAIGFDGENVQGVDIIEPSFRYSQTEYRNNSTVDDAYMKNISDLTGTVNNATFRGWAAGEVLFVGATANRRPDTIWEITYNFQARKNQTGLSVGDITGIAKEGWQYLWTRFQKQEDATAGTTKKVPQFVYVDRLYESSDFASLDLS